MCSVVLPLPFLAPQTDRQIFKTKNVAYKSFQNSIVALASTKTEYVSVTLVAKKTFFYSIKMLKEFNLFTVQIVTLFSDNQSCIKWYPTIRRGLIVYTSYGLETSFPL